MASALQSAGAKRAGPRFPNGDGFGSYPDLGLFVVVDAMGGMLDDPGEIVTLVLSTVRGAYEKVPRGGAGLVVSLQAANEAVLAKSAAGRWRGAGATVVALAVTGAEGHVAHAGDCRAYRLRAGHLEQLTVDHSLRNEMRRQHPELTDEEFARLPANVVTRAIGIAAKEAFELRSFAVAPGDVYLLCSNGLAAFGDREAIQNALERSQSLDATIAHLVDGALARGGKDSLTALLVRV